MKKLFFYIVIMLLLATIAEARHKHPEKWYQDKWCTEHGGKSEVIMPDGTRCDCVTATHAIEFDFGKKWSEAIGQSLNYALQTNKRAGIVMIIEDVKERKYWIRVNSIIVHFKLPIDAWILENLEQDQVSPGSP